MSGCAVAPDGSLLSPSKIDFYNNSDDIVPISGPSLTAPMPSSATNTPSATTLDDFFAPSHSTAVRRTTRLSKPSARVRDAADAVNNIAMTGKRKANDIPRHRVARKTVHESDDSDDGKSSDESTPSVQGVDDTKKAMEYDATDTDEVQVLSDQNGEMGGTGCKVR